MYESIKDLKLEKRGRILVITMDNPPMNPATIDGHTELSKIFEIINHDHDTDVVVLTGAGEKAFSAGGDIKRMMKRYEQNDHSQWYRQMHEARHIAESMLRLEKPLIGRINGHAIGLGATLASFCDITYMMANAKIADTHVNVGMTAGDGGAMMWPLLMGFGKAKYHLFTGEALTGREAAEAGLVNEAVETFEELDEKVYGLAQRLADSPRVALQTTKRAVNLVMRNMLEGLMDAHLGLETLSAWSKDHYEASSAFAERREPKFTGE
ncbi:MAG: enoyl-CoA hydratase/isomerase family protein [Sphingomonadaceae bacterium]|nr:enoyl-CoA hydratase/isomerase family protein [Sphingomonadaceae bacterium]